MNGKKLKNQIAIVTGGSSGIGAGIAKSLSQAGATVIINHSSESSKNKAEDILKEITNAEGTGIIYKADVSKEDEVKQMFADAIKLFGTVDILINNAGIQKDGAFQDMTIEQWNAVIGINLTGQFLCAREAIREFLRRGIVPEKSIAAGKIICMSSVHEVIPWAGHANYAASKGGVMLLMKKHCAGVCPSKIRINSIGPGAIKNSLNSSAWSTTEALDKLLTLIPYKRIGEPEDIGKAVVWLASDDSDYVNGLLYLLMAE